jgi:hypothetical protein
MHMCCLQYEKGCEKARDGFETFDCTRDVVMAVVVVLEGEQTGADGEEEAA